MTEAARTQTGPHGAGSPDREARSALQSGESRRASSPSGGLAAGGLLALQRLAGNQAIGTLVGRRPTVQRQTQAEADQPAEPALQSEVANAILALGRARDLATAAPPDLDSALILVNGVHEWMGEVASSSDVDRVYRPRGFMFATAEIFVGRARAAVTLMRRRITSQQRALRTRPMNRPQFEYDLREFMVAREFLEVLNRERAYEASMGPTVEAYANEMAEVQVSMIPVVGSLVAAGEAIAGRTLYGQRPLGTTERAIIGASAALAALGPVIRTGRVTTQAARMALVSSRTGFGPISLREAWLLTVGTRSLTPAQSARLSELAQAIRSGRTLGAREIVDANRIVSRMREAALVSEALRRTAGEAGGVVGMAGANADEIRVAGALHRHTGRRVTRVVEQAATSRGRTPGATTGDFVVGSELVENVSVRTPRLEALLTAVAKKHRQAGIVAVDMTHTTISPAHVVLSAARLWGKPHMLDVNRIILVRGTDVVGDLLRPPSLANILEAGTATTAVPAGRGAAGTTR